MAIKFTLPDFNAIVREVAVEVKTRVEMRTPVDTGYAQANWELNEGTSSFSIENRTPYIGYLENGTSKMAPVYMVRTTMSEIPEIVANIVAKAPRKPI